jgi:hypothetical protein
LNAQSILINNEKLGLVDNGIKRMDWKDVRGFLSIVRSLWKK